VGLSSIEGYMAIIEGTRAEKTWAGSYDFAVDGGAVSTITLRSNDGPIPLGAVITDGYVDVTSSVLSATGTIALTAEGAGDIVAAVGQASWTAGRKSVVPAGTGVTAVKTTAARSPSMTIGTAVFTAGAFTLVLKYR
jgi:hypothetical protein